MMPGATAERRCWAASIFPIGPAAAAVMGALRRSRRLHWTQRGAKAEAQVWIEEMGLGKVTWEVADDWVTIGRAGSSYTVILIGLLLPLGD